MMHRRSARYVATGLTQAVSATAVVLRLRATERERDREEGKSENQSVTAADVKIRTCEKI